jgi:tetratricopeptide (TPR) repeat protein
MAIRGYTEEVEETYNAALALLKEAGELPQRFQVLCSLACLYLYRGEFDKAAAVGREPLELAEEQDDTGLQVEGHLVLGTNIANIGDIKTGLHHLDRAIALYDRHRHGSGRFRLGPNPGVVSYTTSAFLLWLLGYPYQAVERASSGEELARQLNHPFTIAYALFHAGILDVWRRELKRVHQRASDALVIAEDHDYQVWRAVALVFQGVAMTSSDRPEEGLAQITRGMALYQGLKTPPVFWPVLLSLRARARAFAGQPADGLDAIDEAIAMIPEKIY